MNDNENVWKHKLLYYMNKHPSVINVREFLFNPSNKNVKFIEMFFNPYLPRPRELLWVLGDNTHQDRSGGEIYERFT